MRLLLLASLSLLGACAVSPWPALHEPATVHDARCATCQDLTHGGVIVAPEAMSDRQLETARLCGYRVPGR